MTGAAPELVAIIVEASDAGRGPQEIHEMLRARGVSDPDIATACREAGERLRRQGEAMKRQGEALRRLSDEVRQIAAEMGIATHPKTPIARILEIAADRGNKRAIALLEALRR
jgi:hypothetical protein